MKKIISLLLTLCLLCSSAAMAEEYSGTINNAAPEMTITYQITSGFTVVIPSDLTINESDFTVSDVGTVRTGKVDITVKGGGSMDSGKKFQLCIWDSQNDFNLKYNDYSIPYGIYVDSSDTALAENQLIFDLTAMPAEDLTKELTIKFVTSAPVAGSYTDELSFFMGFE